MTEEKNFEAESSYHCLSQHFESLGKFLDHFNTSEFIDYTYLFGMVPVSVIGSVFCCISISIFFKKEFKAKTYDYYKLWSIVQAFHVITSIGYGLSYSPRVVTLYNAYVSAIYTLFYIPIANLCFYYSGVIEIAIVFDRFVSFFLHIILLEIKGI